MQRKVLRSLDWSWFLRGLQLRNALFLQCFFKTYLSNFLTSFRELFKLKLKLKESWMFLDLVEAISCIIIDLLVTKGAKFLHSFDAHGFSFFYFQLLGVYCKFHCVLCGNVVLIEFCLTIWSDFESFESTICFNVICGFSYIVYEENTNAEAGALSSWAQFNF